MSMKDITLGRYVYGTSVLHVLDPRTKLLSLFAVTAVLFTRNGWKALCLVGVYAGAACVLSGLKPSYLFRSLLPFKWLILMTICLNMVFVGGHILIEGPFPYGGITSEGLTYGLLYGSRIALLVLLASILTLTTEPIVLVDGIEKLIAPLSKIRLKPHEIATAMVITIRFIPILLDEAEKIRKSHIARGMRSEGGIGVKLKFISLLFMPLFHSAVRRADTLAVAMECRMYRSGIERTRYSKTTMTSRDWTALAISCLLAFGTLTV